MNNIVVLKTKTSQVGFSKPTKLACNHTFLPYLHKLKNWCMWLLEWRNGQSWILIFLFQKSRANYTNEMKGGRKVMNLKDITEVITIHLQALLSLVTCMVEYLHYAIMSSSCWESCHKWTDCQSWILISLFINIKLN
jgi:hypothetical protein